MFARIPRLCRSPPSSIAIGYICRDALQSPEQLQGAKTKSVHVANDWVAV
jgi:hypothetical protein